MTLMLAHQKQLTEFGHLLQDGKGVKISFVERKDANMQLMPSTLKEYTFYYQANDNTVIEADDSHDIDVDINVIKDHFKLATVETILDSGYMRGKAQEIRC